MTDEYTAVTRFADLDTQRHVTSRTYEQFALEGRYRLLAQWGYSMEKILAERIYPVPLAGFAKFHRQQFPGASLVVKTAAFASGKAIHWQHGIFTAQGELVAELELKTQLLRGSEPILPEGLPALEKVPRYFELPRWSGHNRRLVGLYTMPYSDRDFAGRYNVAALWRVFEEGRWLFAEKTGLTYEKIVELDTTSFYMGSVYNCYGEIPAGTTVQIMTWIERVEKIRYYFRQDVLHNGRLLMAMRDEQLIVSLSKSRPQRATPQFLELLGDFIEFRSES